MQLECKHYLFGGIEMTSNLGQSLLDKKSEYPKIALTLNGKMQCLTIALCFFVFFLIAISEMRGFCFHYNVTLIIIFYPGHE
jgi:hypothetical protein